MHILFIPTWYPTTEQPNSGRFFKDQITLLANSDVQVGVVFPEDRSIRFLTPSNLRSNHFQMRFYEENGIPTYRQHGWRFIPNDTPLYTRFWISQVQQLVDRYVREYGKPDLLHALVAYPAGCAARIAAERLKIPYLITEHSSMYLQHLFQPWQVPWLHTAFGKVSAVIAVSQALADAVQPYTNRPVTVIPNYIDTDFFYLPSVARQTTPFTFLAVGNLVPVKGYDILLQAFKQTLSLLPDTMLRLGGEGMQRTRLETLTGELGIRDHVTFLGRLTKEQVREEMWKANALVVSSRHETFSIVLIEALATGLPTLATRSGGPQGIVTEQVGILVPSSDITALADGLRDIMSRSFDPQVIRTYATQKYSPETVVNQLLTCYHQVLEIDSAPHWRHTL